MHDSNQLIQQVRVRLNTERQIVSDLDAKLRHDSIKQLLKRASNSLDDVENIFLRSAEQERRSPEDLRKWLSYTDMVFQIAALQRRVVEDALATYGPDVIAIYPR